MFDLFSFTDIVSNLFWFLIFCVICFIFYRFIVDNRQTGKQSNNKATNEELNSQELLKHIIVDLKKLLLQHKISHESVKHLLQFYESKLEATAPSGEETETEENVLLPQEKNFSLSSEKQEIQIPNLVQQWYQENTISFLLYLGAFLIVIACITFLSFTWSSLTGWARFLSFAGFTALFGIVGAYLATRPKVAQAGVTFLGIMAILLPLNGAAFQRFVLTPHSTIAPVWIVTSVLCLGIYAVIFRYFSNRFYATLLNLSSLSLVEAFINLSDGDKAYYIFGGLISAFIMYGFGKYMHKLSRDAMKTVFDYESQSVLIISVIVGFVYLSLQGNIFTKEAVIALFLSGVYYSMLYFYETPIYFIPATIFFIATVIFYGKFVHWTDFLLMLTCFYVAFLQLCISFFLHGKTNYQKEQAWSLSLSFLPTALGVIFGFLSVANMDTILQWQFALMLYLVSGYFIFRYVIQTYPNDIGASISAFTATYVLTQYYHIPPLGTAYTLLGCGFASLFGAYLWKKHTRIANQFLAAIVLGLLYTTLAVVYALGNTLPNGSMTWITFFWSIGFAITYFMHNRKAVHLIPFFIAVSIWIYFTNNDYLQSLFPNLPSLAYSYFLATAIVLVFYNDKSPLKYVFSFGMILFTVCSYAFLVSNENSIYITLLALFHIFLGIYAATKYKNDLIILVPQFFLYLFVYYLITYLQDGDYLVFWLSLTAGIAYSTGIAAYLYLKEKTRSQYTIYFALATATSMAIISIFQPENDKSILSFSHVLSIVFAASYVTHYWYRRKFPNFEYIATFMWLLSIEKFLQYIGITNWNVYYQPFTYYIFCIGLYHHFKKKSSDIPFLLAGMTTSIIPLVFQSYGAEGIYYALYLAAESVICMLIGISLGLRKVRYGGLIGLILAVVLQTSQYILDLPRWLLIGLLGLIIIIAATYLLSKKEDKN